jgi:hypothetical protein
MRELVGIACIKIRVVQPFLGRGDLSLEALDLARQPIVIALILVR